MLKTIFNFNSLSLKKSLARQRQRLETQKSVVSLERITNRVRKQS
ncbi:MAG: hypothetical protein AVDCRST_MAG74-322 [uncultured Pyrinomonadaceae bacterium]|uniref:Uncharacterized protein n=1 Tax=uncultured Pyrinomonadaceae bacterium TaxID=2283094 RepID=A0A6J4N5M5_9BACT|nr:MAG: hypothetical protein AVDCRST_MAG74-322 [uncultured Pyrinomonadaceae bacterium]